VAADLPVQRLRKRGQWPGQMHPIAEPGGLVIHAAAEQGRAPQGRAEPHTCHWFLTMPPVSPLFSLYAHHSQPWMGSRLYLAAPPCGEGGEEARQGAQSAPLRPRHSRLPALQLLGS